MYKLSLNNEEFHTLKNLVTHAKAQNPSVPEPSVYSDLISKLIVAQLEAQDEEAEEAEGQRYAMNLHSRPEGA